MIVDKNYEHINVDSNFRVEDPDIIFENKSIKKKICVISSKKIEDEIVLKLENIYYCIRSDDIFRLEHFLKYCIPNVDYEFDWERLYPFNHYDSPYATKEDIRNNAFFNDIDDFDGLNIDDQIFVSQLEEIKDNVEMFKYDLKVFGTKGVSERRYRVKNGFYGFFDALILYTNIKKYKPKRIIEVGSGFSTLVMLDTIEELGLDTKITCIEPYPERLKKNLRYGDINRIELIEKKLQNTDMRIFGSLSKDDLLFIDSSHVAKCGSDIQFLYFKILPNLNKNVKVHIHDIFKHFTYPDEWVVSGDAYNEGFIVRAMLMNNEKWKILFFTNYVTSSEKFDEHRIVWDYEKFGLYYGNSLWIEKV